MKSLRTQLNRILKARGYRLQKQGYDHVLRDNERSPDGLGEVSAYIRANPVRAGLCKESKEYPFSGCVVPGYPDLDIDEECYWDRFWKVYWTLRD
jgi:putative transposase